MSEVDWDAVYGKTGEKPSAAKPPKGVDWAAVYGDDLKQAEPEPPKPTLADGIVGSALKSARKAIRENLGNSGLLSKEPNVLERPPADAPEGPSLIEQRGAPVTEETAGAIKRAVGSMPKGKDAAPFTPEALATAKETLKSIPPGQRAAQLARTDLPKWMRSAMQAAAKQIDQEDQAYQSTGVASPEASGEVRADQLIKSGLRGDDAQRVGQYEAGRGGLTQPLAQATNGIDPGVTGEEAQQAQAEGAEYQRNSLAVQSGYQAAQGLKQAFHGGMAMALRAAGDEEGAKLYEAEGAKNKIRADAATELQTMRRRAGEAGIVNTGLADYGERLGAGAMNSVGQMIPGIVAGGAAALATGNPLVGARVGISLMSGQVFGQEFIAGRTQGLSPTHATARAGVMAALEYIGERYGLFPQAMNKLMGKAAATKLEELPAWADRAVQALEKRGMFAGPVGKIVTKGVVQGQVGEQVGEQITGAGQYLLDGTKLGLDQQISVAGFLENMRDTAVQTALATGVMQMAGAGAGALRPGEKDRQGRASAADAAENAKRTALGNWQQAFGGAPGGQVVPPATTGPAAAATGATAPAQAANTGATPTAKPTNDAPLDAGALLGTPIDEGVPPAAEAPIEGDKINRNWTAFSPESGTLNIPREQMPQVKAEHRGALVNFLAARGVTSESAEVEADSLRPTQTEFSPQKVQKARDFTGGDRSILVSQDGYVLDGHHQWLAKREAGDPVKIIRLDAPIQDLLRLAHQFPSSTTASGAKRAAAAQEVATDDNKPDLDGAAGLVAGAADGRAPAGLGGGGTVGSQPAVDAGVGTPAAPPVPGSGTAVPAGSGNQADQALSDTPDFEHTYPRPTFGKDSQFDGMQDDPAMLAQAVKGVHEEAAAGIAVDLMAARAARDSEDTEALTGSLGKIDAALREYADEFGPEHAAAFQARVAPGLDELRKVTTVVTPAAPKVTTVVTPDGKSQAEQDADAALDDLGDVLGTGNAGAPVQADSGSAAPAPGAAAPDVSTNGGKPNTSDEPAQGTPESEQVKAKKERTKKAAKGVSFYPKTVWGSEMLAGINRQLGGLSPKLMTSLSFKRDIGLKDRNGNPRTAWHNPSAGKNIKGGLFREGGVEDTNLIAEWMEREGYITPGTMAADYTAADEEARRLITAALNREPTPTMAEQERAAEDYRAEEERLYREMEAKDAEQLEADRLAVMAENDIRPAEMEAADDEFIALDELGQPDPVTLETLLLSFGWSDAEINDAIFREQQVADANEAARELEQARSATQPGQETGSDGPGRPGATDPAGAATQGPSGDDYRKASEEVDAAVGRLTDEQIDQVSAAVGIREDATPEAKRTLLLTRDALEVLAAIQQLPPAFDLAAPTPEDLKARADMEAAARRGDMAEQRRLAAVEAERRRALEKQRELAGAEKIRKERADAAVDGFELGQEPPSARVTRSDIVGQEDIFAQPEVQSAPTATRDEALIDLRKRAAVLKSLRECLG